MTAAPTFEPRRHRYSVDGVVYPSVTTILGIINKPELTAWVGRLGNEEANRQRDEAAEHGTRIHSACEVVAKGWDTDESDAWAGDAEPWVGAYRDWLNANIRTVIAAEPRVASRIHQCAGSIDLVAEMIDGSTAILDLKTGSMVPDTTPLQCAAYGRLLLEQDGIQTTRRLAIHLPRKSPGTLNVIEYPPEDELTDWRAFLACLIVWRRFAKKERR